MTCLSLPLQRKRALRKQNEPLLVIKYITAKGLDKEENPLRKNFLGIFLNVSKSSQIRLFETAYFFIFVYLRTFVRAYGFSHDDCAFSFLLDVLSSPVLPEDMSVRLLDGKVFSFWTAFYIISYWILFRRKGNIKHRHYAFASWWGVVVFIVTLRDSTRENVARYRSAQKSVLLHQVSSQWLVIVGKWR